MSTKPREQPDWSPCIILVHAVHGICTLFVVHVEHPSPLSYQLWPLVILKYFEGGSSKVFVHSSVQSGGHGKSVHENCTSLSVVTMETSFTWTLAWLCLFLGVVLSFVRYQPKRHPPGPWFRIPFIGNAYLFLGNPMKNFSDMRKK